MEGERSHPPVEIDLSGDVRSYFEELVTGAVEQHRMEAPPAVTTYLTALLAEYAHPDSRSRHTLEQPFTLLLAEAFESNGSERFERLRALGDGALYVRGFFSEHLETRGVALRYVSEVGARAYDGAASMLRQSARGASESSSAPDLFGELAERFDALVTLVGSVADRILAQGGKNSDGGVLRLYERWLRTGSSELAAALGQRGLVPLRPAAGVS